MKAARFALFLIASTCLYGVDLKEHLKPLDAVDADEWWLNSWKKDREYIHHVDYEVDSEVSLKYNSVENPDGGLERVLNYTKTLVSDTLAKGGAVHGHFTGHGDFITEVFDETPNLFLHRYYSIAGSDMTLYLGIEYSSPPGKVLGFLVGGGLSGIIASAGVAFSSVPYVGPVAMAAAGYIEGILADLENKSQIIKNKEKDAYVLPSTSPLFKNYLASGGNTGKLAQFGDIAFTVSSEFKGSHYVLMEMNKKIDSRKIGVGDIKEILNRNELKKNFYKLPDCPPVAKALFQRESFAINRQLFDSKKRKPGDVWVVSADFFNTFLHPDLKGKISGRVVLQYTADVGREVKISGGKFKYDARVIRVINSASIDGSAYYTDMEYNEPDFKARFDPDESSIYVYVDIKSGIVAEAVMKLEGSSDSNLPDTPLTRGFKSVGRTTLRINFATQEDRDNVTKIPVRDDAK